MKKIRIDAYSELERIKELSENEFIINLEDCPISQRKRVVDFLSGLTFLNGSLKKLNSNEFEIEIVSKVKESRY